MWTVRSTQNSEALAIDLFYEEAGKGWEYIIGHNFFSIDLL